MRAGIFEENVPSDCADKRIRWNLSSFSKTSGQDVLSFNSELFSLFLDSIEKEFKFKLSLRLRPEARYYELYMESQMQDDYELTFQVQFEGLPKNPRSRFGMIPYLDSNGIQIGNDGESGPVTLNVLGMGHYDEGYAQATSILTKSFSHVEEKIARQSDQNLIYVLLRFVGAGQVKRKKFPQNFSHPINFPYPESEPEYNSDEEAYETALREFRIRADQRLRADFNAGRIDPKSKNNLQDDMTKAFLNGLSTDFTIICEHGDNGQKKTSFKVQKNRLVTRSPVFAAALDNFAEGENATYKISDMSPKAVKEMLRFFYTDQVENLEVHARELLMAGDKYDLPKLRNMAELKLCQTLNHDNVLDCLKFADLINTAKLKNYAIACIANTFETISQRSEWADFAAQNPVLVEAINAKRIEREYCEEAIQVQPGPDPFNNPF